MAATRGPERLHLALSFASPVPGYPASVSQVVFADATDGWLYGNSLWATYNGAHTWRPINLHGPVFSLASSASVAYALVGNVRQRGGRQAPQVRLERSSVGSSSWQIVPGISGYGTSAIITANGENAWVSLSPRRSRSGPALGHHGRRRQLAQPARLLLPAGAGDRPHRVGITGWPGGAGTVCGKPGCRPRRVSPSGFLADGGSTSHLVSQLPLGGLTQGMAAVGNENVYVTAASGASDVYSSSNEGRTWGGPSSTTEAPGLTDIAFPTTSFGTAIEGQPALGPAGDRLLVTENGGATWVGVGQELTGLRRAENHSVNSRRRPRPAPIVPPPARGSGEGRNKGYKASRTAPDFGSGAAKTSRLTRGGEQAPGAHRAGFQGDVQCRPGEPPCAERLRRLAEGNQFRVRASHSRVFPWELAPFPMISS